MFELWDLYFRMPVQNTDVCIIASKIYGTAKYIRSILKLHSILAVTNLLAHNSISQICYCDQISLQSNAVKCSFSENLTALGVPFLLLEMVLKNISLI